MNISMTGMNRVKKRVVGSRRMCSISFRATASVRRILRSMAMPYPPRPTAPMRPAYKFCHRLFPSPTPSGAAPPQRKVRDVMLDWQEFRRRVDDADHVLLTTHVRPDGD